MIRKIIFAILMSLLVVAATAQTTKPPKVEISQKGQQFQLLRSGQSLILSRGRAAASTPTALLLTVAIPSAPGGSRNGRQVLDSAQYYGLTVLMGLDVARERHGFNYDDTVAVGKQLNELRADVLTYKDHPGLLAWGIGNELNLQYKNPRVWNAVNDIAKMIHALDPNHPVCTVIAGINKDLVNNIRQRCPDIDFLAVNTYGG